MRRALLLRAALRRLLASTVAATALATAAHAQVMRPTTPTFRSLVRVDAIVAHASAAQLGVGLAVPAGTYVRVEATVAGGVTRRDGATVGGGRVDLVGRFLLDPFAETARGPYAGGGLSVRADGGDHNAHAFLLAVVGVEGRRRGGLYPALELGLGGGVRLGLALRAAPAGRR